MSLNARHELLREIHIGSQPTERWVGDGARVIASVGAALLGNPLRFTWIARANDWPQFGTNSVQTLDRAPDTGPALWP